MIPSAREILEYVGMLEIGQTLNQKYTVSYECMMLKDVYELPFPNLQNEQRAVDELQANKSCSWWQSKAQSELPTWSFRPKLTKQWAWLQIRDRCKPWARNGRVRLSNKAYCMVGKNLVEMCNGHEADESQKLSWIEEDHRRTIDNIEGPSVTWLCHKVQNQDDVHDV